MSGHAANVVNDNAVRAAAIRAWCLETVAILDQYGPSIVPHLMDTDENTGQRLRDALAWETSPEEVTELVGLVEAYRATGQSWAQKRGLFALVPPSAQVAGADPDSG